MPHPGNAEPNPKTGETPPFGDAGSLHNPAETDPDLARIIAAWPTLPEPIRRAMLALVESAPGGP
jgi:hypothetical protein